MTRNLTALLTAGLIVAGLHTTPLHANPSAEPVDLDMVTRIRQEGLHRSQVMATIAHLADVIGPRLSGSPGMRQSNDWTRDKLAEWGLANARLEEFDFGKGWSFSHVSVHMPAPRAAPIIAYPRAWTPGTDRSVRGPVVRVSLTTDADLEQHRGALTGKIILMDDARPIVDRDESLIQRYDHDSLESLVEFPIPGGAVQGRRMPANFAQILQFREKLNAYLVEEGALATFHISTFDYGAVRTGAGGSHAADAGPGVPSLQLSTEHYNLLSRLVAGGHEVEVELRVDAEFHDEDLKQYNTIAEIPGSGRTARDIVLAGAHLDSWHPGTGATDNAAGVAVVMEAVRILKALDVKPRRTIRVALWGAEEQGLFGSRAYVERHIATRPSHTDPDQLTRPSWMRTQTWPITPLAGHARHVAYFNYGNGGGRIRGIYAEENAAVVPIFESWLKPLHDLGATTVTLRTTGGTDHQSFDRVGVPGFQFIQDGMDYFSRTHHSHLDTLDYIRAEDVTQAAVVLATFLYHAAMRDDPLPRKPMPTAPVSDN